MTMPTPEEREARRLENEAAFQRLGRYMGEGSTVAHTVCGNTLREHILTGIVEPSSDKGWTLLRGYPTGDTMRMEGIGFHEADDIFPLHILWIDRVPVSSIEDHAAPVDEPFIGEEMSPEDSAALDREIDAMAAQAADAADDDLPF